MLFKVIIHYNIPCMGLMIIRIGSSYTHMTKKRELLVYEILISTFNKTKTSTLITILRHASVAHDLKNVVFKM